MAAVREPIAPLTRESLDEKRNRRDRARVTKERRRFARRARDGRERLGDKRAERDAARGQRTTAHNEDRGQTQHHDENREHHKDERSKTIVAKGEDGSTVYLTDIDGDHKADITISGNDTTRILNISGSLYVALQSLTLTNGHSDSLGGAIFASHILNFAITDTTIQASHRGLNQSRTRPITCTKRERRRERRLRMA